MNVIEPSDGKTDTIDQNMFSGMDSLNDIKLGRSNIINSSGLPGS